MGFGTLGWSVGGRGGNNGKSLSDYMELVFDTSLAAGTDIEVPLFGTVDVTVDWGDGSSDIYATAGVKTHTYAGEGVYFVRITGALTGFGHQTAAATAARAQKLIGCSGWGNLGITSVEGAFRDASNLVSAPDHLPANVTNTSLMFHTCTNFDQSVANFNTAAVTNMAYMFHTCTNFNQSVANFNTAAVTNMSEMFANCPNFNQSVANFNTAAVTNMSTMFYGCTNFDQSVANFNTAAVTNMEYMFYGCTAMSGAGIDAFSLAGLNAATSLTNFATSATFSTANYDAILIAWDAAKAGYRTDLAPHFGSSTYSAGAAATARGALVTHGWTITDGGAA